MCDFQKDVVRALGLVGYSASVNANGVIIVQVDMCQVSVSVQGHDRVMHISTFDINIPGLKQEKYGEPEGGFSVDVTVNRIVDYCKVVECLCYYRVLTGTGGQVNV